MKGWEETDFSIHIRVAFRDIVRLLDGLSSQYYYSYFVVKMQMMRKKKLVRTDMTDSNNA